MTGGDPPHPPSRTPYPPWQARGYRRRPAAPPNPPAGRNGWVGRRPRSPPPPSSLRSRHPRPALHKHQRHASQQHPPPSQSNNPSSYHHHGPPPLSRNLQNRLRASSRSPPPRRSDPPSHRSDPPSHRSDPHPHRSDTHPHCSDPHSHRADPHPHRSDPHPHRSELPSHRPDQHPHSHSHRPELHPSRPDQHSSRGEQHPYRGEPGPAHRVDPLERGYRGGDSFEHGGYRGGDYDYGPRPTQGKSRGEMSSYRSEQGSHRTTGDHHVPYRGEPGPLYRADSGSHRDDLDSRRGGPDAAGGRNESHSGYGSWFRNPSKIHKPAKMKKRRFPPHIAGALRMSSQAQLKPESPILSRVGFPHLDRAGGSSRPDASSSPANFSGKPSNSGFPGSSARWYADQQSRYSGAASPRASQYEGDAAKRGERNLRYQSSSSVSTGPPKRPPSGDRQRSMSPRSEPQALRRDAMSRGDSTPPRDRMGSGPQTGRNIGKALDKELPGTHPPRDRQKPPTARPPPREPLSKRLSNPGMNSSNRSRDQLAIRGSEPPEQPERRPEPSKSANNLGDRTAQRPSIPVAETTAQGQQPILKTRDAKPANALRFEEPVNGPSTGEDGASARTATGMTPFTDGRIMEVNRRRQTGSILSMGKDDRLTARNAERAERFKTKNWQPRDGAEKTPKASAKVSEKQEPSNSDDKKRHAAHADCKLPTTQPASGGTSTQGTRLEIVANGTKDREDVVRRDVGKGTERRAEAFDSQNKTKNAVPERVESDDGHGSSAIEATGDVTTSSERHGERNASVARKSTESERKDTLVATKDVMRRGEQIKAVAPLKGKLSTSAPVGDGTVVIGTDVGGDVNTSASAARPSSSSELQPDAFASSNPALRSGPVSTTQPIVSAEAKSGMATKIELRSVLSSLQLQSSSSALAPVSTKNDRERPNTQPFPKSGTVALAQEVKGLEKSMEKGGMEKGVMKEVCLDANETSQGVKEKSLRIDLRSVLSSTRQLTTESSTAGSQKPELLSSPAPRDLPLSALLSLGTPRTPRLEPRSVPRVGVSDCTIRASTTRNSKLHPKGAANAEPSGVVERNAIPRIAQSPVSVPAPALSLLRSSPRARPRMPVTDLPLNSVSSFVQCAAPTQPVPVPKENATLHSDTGQKRNGLVEEIHATEERISALEKKLAQYKPSSPSSSTAKTSKSTTLEPSPLFGDRVVEDFSSIAEDITRQVDEDITADVEPSLHPLNVSLRLVLTQNRAKAAASSAAFRSICSDTELGLDAGAVFPVDLAPPISSEMQAHIAAEIAREKAGSVGKRRRLGREYNDMRKAWLRKLKSARDKKSKEKREVIRERDRFLVLCTKGQNARLSSRTSSGRMSTKIFPSLNSFGQVNGTSDVDALLADIAAAGGTPGLKDIWSKTLAAIPDQDASVRPCDCTSVLIEDPMFDFHASRAVNPWHFEEKLIFIEKFIAYPKNFRKIASFLERKSPRECSYFYYANKLDIALKQLCKESSTMKRKGILRSHIVSLARKRHSPDSEEVVTLQTEAFLQRQNQFAPAHKNGNHSDALASQNGGNGGNSASHEKKRTASTGMMLKKRIYAEFSVLNLTDIDKEKFSGAIAKFGFDWKHVAKYMDLPGKTSTHYREYYRRNKRKLRIEASERHDLMRSPAHALRHSPRMTPRSSPRASPPLMQDRIADIVEPVPISLLDRRENVSARKRPRQNGSPSSRHSGLLSDMHTDISGGGAPNITDGENRKNKTSTWTLEEMDTFKQLFKRHGRDWKKIAQLMTPKTPTQVKGFWRTVADEVGNGFPAESSKVSKAERKKSKRSTSGESATRHNEKRRDRERSESHEKPKKLLKDSPSGGGTSQDEGISTDVRILGPVRGRSTGEDGKLSDMEHEDREGRRSPESLGASKAAAESSMSIGGSASREYWEDKKRRSGEGVVISKGEADFRERSMTRLPLLRSAPPPMLRSVPPETRQHNASPLAASPAASPRTRADSSTAIATSEKDTSEGKRDNELRRAAQSYGVLELLGSRLSDTTEGQKQR